jgi:CMP-N,N'-diacetyllegionaminic acid synthase
LTNKFENTLFLIPARGGSKGLPGKNIKELFGKPLLYYTIDAARGLVDDDNICLSTDSDEIIQVAKEHSLAVPFKRPDEYASDKSGTTEVIQHALNHYINEGRHFQSVILLQPTSPLRTSKDISQAFELFSDDIDMVVSVCKCKSNPFYNLFEQTEYGYLKKTFETHHSQRQDLKSEYYQYNGAIYIINTSSFFKSAISEFQKVKKYEMSTLNSIDIDTYDDWKYAEYLLQKHD